jgi:general secretion pathway protein E
VSSQSVQPERLELGEMLLRGTRLSPEQLDVAQRRQAETGGRLVEILIEDGSLTEDELLDALGQQLAIRVRREIRTEDVDEGLIARVPIGFAKTHKLLPLKRDALGILHVAISDPFDTSPLDDLRLLFDGSEIEGELAGERVILTAINQVYDRGTGSAADLASDAVTDLEALAQELSHSEPQDLLEAADEAPIIKLVNSLLQQAVKERASDVHIEPHEREIRVRFRIDDLLYEPMHPLPRAIQSSVASRIKIMGGLNIAEKRLPQDGRIRLKIAGRDYDVRLSTVPIAHGERIVMRLLPRTTEMLNLETLGFNESQMQVWEKLISRPNGIVLVTGPTGSGKTTTLYGALSRINTSDRNIITIEDPVEIQLPGTGQIEVNPKIGLTFASGLRSVLRQDPNVILVGEIRDLETAEIAIQASLTGHLVFSTLHTTDAASAITRLVDMGVEPYLVASSLVAVLAQRLVRVLCVHCKEPWEPTPEQLGEIGIRSRGGAVRCFRPTGCERCNHTGYRGRIGIFELMLIDDEIRALVTQNIDSKSIKRKAMDKGMNSLRADGARKVLSGQTSIAEVLRATEDEGGVAQI